MTHDEMIERIADAVGEGGGESESVKGQAGFWLGVFRAAGFEVVAQNELAALRANQIPPGWVCVDPEGPIPGYASDAFDRTARIHDEYGENRYVENTDDTIRAYLRALRDQQKGASTGAQPTSPNQVTIEVER